VRRLAKFSNQYRWEWQPAEVEAFFDNVQANNPNFTVSAVRQHQNSLRISATSSVDNHADPRGVRPAAPKSRACSRPGLFLSAEAREGMLAFLHKRPPRWAHDTGF
jgi:hypothetical protein